MIFCHPVGIPNQNNKYFLIFLARIPFFFISFNDYYNLLPVCLKEIMLKLCNRPDRDEFCKKKKKLESYKYGVRSIGRVKITLNLLKAIFTYIHENANLWRPLIFGTIELET